ncbi:MAG: topoisomerase [Frankiales bacterium]|nr:topoisomerase [Frankiales bacterium]
MPRLKRVSCTAPGLARVRRGKGFRYVDAAGNAVTDEATLARIEALVLPPAWEDVWICPLATGHIQATGVDARGRRQYRYHDQWRVMRDLAKHERILDFAQALPAAREQIQRDLHEKGMTRRRVLSCAVRLLDLGFFRVGSEQYAEENGTFGLATIRKEHVTVSRSGVITFEYTAKSSKHRVQQVADPDVSAVVSAMKRRREGDDELLAWWEGTRKAGRWVDVKSHDINEHLRELLGGDYSAKDFRTWNATTLAAVGLAVSSQVAPTATARKKAVTRVVKEVAEYLGNTPAVCRSSYIDPRVIDLFEHGETVWPDLEALGEDGVFGQPATQGAVEAAVLRLLRVPAEQAERLAG